jgi:hypothetical protein
MITMTPESVDNFLSLYLRSLVEESRPMKTGPRFGFDRVIHQLALADGCIEVRLPFFRESGEDIPRPKKEAEHGVDMSFLTNDKKTLLIFVLKGVALTYKSFYSNEFDKDLRLAAAPDTDDPIMPGVESIKIILAYNKDDDEEGIESFNRLTKTLGTKVADRMELSFDRWNLTRITNLVSEKLLTPALLPENFFKKFSYICSQFSDFDTTSPHWSELLLPDWRDLLHDILKGPVKETNVRLISITLIVLRQHAKRDHAGKASPGSHLGWIELVEWAMLALSKATNAAPKKLEKEIRRIFFESWTSFYLTEVQSFYREHGEALASHHVLEIPGEPIEDAGGSYRAHWHLGRLGILAMAISELTLHANEEAKRAAGIEWLREINNWLIGLLNASPSCYRPMLDIQHIEQYLVWQSLARMGRWDDIASWMLELTDRIYIRYLGVCEIPGIDYRNSWELLMEGLTGADSENSIPSNSSYLVLMLMELCLMFPDGRGEQIIQRLHKQFVEDLEDNQNESPKAPSPLNLCSWRPPEDWLAQVLAGTEGGHGVSVVLGRDDPAGSLLDFVTKSHDPKIDQFGPPELPSVVALACLRYCIPLPPVFWRRFLSSVRSDS